jgi:hypothetical protein
MKADCPFFIAEGLTIGVPYPPAMPDWLKPNPKGRGDPKKTALVTLIPEKTDHVMKYLKMFIWGVRYLR